MAAKSEPSESISTTVFNVPNQLTSLRLILAIVMFCLLALDTSGVYIASMVLFVLAAGTDWMDGWYARKYNQVTVLGRILDPFADKIIICGSFIFLAAEPGLMQAPYGLRPWMAVVVVGRELLVTALRGFIEQRGGDFSANMAGKLKMVLQCAAVVSCLLYLSYTETPPDWLHWTMIASVWSAIALTVYSGLIYVVTAVKMVKQSS